MAIQPRAPILTDVLDAHNSFRAQHGAAPLMWNDTLANAAETFANKCVFQTSGGPYGENVAAGAGGGYNAMRAVQSWMAGACFFRVKAKYDPKNPTGNQEALAFTQMVWKNTTMVGCAAAQCGDKLFGSNFPSSMLVVCEYYAPGNVNGQFSQNVQP
ncbi:hypothetical protein AAF712_010555 [Marasmius tenuissimus]|uniref:SCP domain-containing protein n=1 Tax=Marasmius tenuissimus TaxID=585030 RepID=A0ABR2ZM16_9AGAR